MFGKWITHYDGSVEGRSVTVQTYSEGGYRVKTTQGEDYDGNVFGDETSIAIIPPTPKGRPISIDGETVDEVKRQLTLEGFSESAINEIALHFPI